MAQIHELLFEARGHLGFTNVALAKFLGVSLRTVQRYSETAGCSTTADYHKVIRGVHPHNPDLAARLASCLNTSLEQLGLAAPKQPVAIALRPELADAVVCAVADALRLVPSDARPGVVALFKRSRELGVDLASLAWSFDSPPTKAAKK